MRRARKSPRRGRKMAQLRSFAPCRGFVYFPASPRLSPWAILLRSYELGFGVFLDLHFSVAHPFRRERHDPEGELDEPVPDLHSPAGGHHDADGGHPAGRRGGVYAATRLGVAGGGLSDHSSHYVLSRRQPGRDGVFGDRAARASVRAGARTPANDFDKFDGSSVITLQFNLSLSIDIAEQEVQQSINASGTYLPADLPAPPIYSKTN